MPSRVHAWSLREVYAVGRDSVTNQNRICVYIKKSLNSHTICRVISGFRCGLSEICALLGFYAAWNGSFFLDCLTPEGTTDRFPEKSEINCHSTPR
jgi:hypothetical protein